MPFVKQPSQQSNVLIYKAEGKITGADYTENLIPAMNELLKEFNKIRMVFDISDMHLKDMSWTAMWEDSKLGFSKLNSFEKFALVCSHDKLASVFMPIFIGIKTKTFPKGNIEEAINWIKEDDN